MCHKLERDKQNDYMYALAEASEVCHKLERAKQKGYMYAIAEASEVP